MTNDGPKMVTRLPQGNTKIGVSCRRSGILAKSAMPSSVLSPRGPKVPPIPPKTPRDGPQNGSKSDKNRCLFWEYFLGPKSINFGSILEAFWHTFRLLFGIVFWYQFFFQVRQDAHLLFHKEQATKSYLQRCMIALYLLFCDI